MSCIPLTRWRGVASVLFLSKVAVSQSKHRIIIMPCIRWRRVASVLFLSKVGLSLWLLVYTLLGGLTILATETVAGQHKLEEDSQVKYNTVIQ